MPPVIRPGLRRAPRVTARVTLSVVTATTLVAFGPVNGVSSTSEAVPAARPLAVAAPPSTGPSVALPPPPGAPGVPAQTEGESDPAFSEYPERSESPDPGWDPVSEDGFGGTPGAATLPEAVGSEPATVNAPTGSSSAPADPGSTSQHARREVTPEPAADAPDRRQARASLSAASTAGPARPGASTPTPPPATDLPPTGEAVVPPAAVVTAPDIDELASALGDGWARLELTDEAQVEAATLGAWWALVVACGDELPSVRVACGAAADRVLVSIAGVVPDPGRWEDVPQAARDAAYQLARDLLPRSAPGQPVAPAELPAWAGHLRRSGDG